MRAWTNSEVREVVINLTWNIVENNCSWVIIFPRAEDFQ